MSKYLITLTPTERFFFGGDITFSYSDQKSEYDSYIIRSNRFPQQTSLLGMLRFLILRNDKNAFDESKQEIKDRKQASDLIGAKSFRIGEHNDFGVIKSISPCFIQLKDNGEWTNMDIIPFDESLSVDYSQNTSVTLNGLAFEIPSMEYNPKEGIKRRFKYANSKYKNVEDIFEEDLRNGIDRDIKTGKTEDAALFKQISYRFKEECRFAFEADVERVELKQYSGQVVSVGGDSSQFIIEIFDISNHEATKTTKGGSVVLLSPSYIEDISSVRFAITETITFKCMKTETEKINSYNKKNEVYDYSKKVSLYDAGSVFYCKEVDAFIKEIKKHSDFRQIGYNHFIVK